jgi:hypothetical protein
MALLSGHHFDSGFVELKLLEFARVRRDGTLIPRSPSKLMVSLPPSQATGAVSINDPQKFESDDYIGGPPLSIGHTSSLVHCL